MRPPVVVLALSLVIAAAAGCGGSASESPWPVEPEHREGAPAAEGANAGAPLEDRSPESRGEVSADGPRRNADAGAPISSPLPPPPRKKP